MGTVHLIFLGYHWRHSRFGGPLYALHYLTIHLQSINGNLEMGILVHHSRSSLERHLTRLGRLSAIFLHPRLFHVRLMNFLPIVI